MDELNPQPEPDVSSFTADGVLFRQLLSPGEAAQPWIQSLPPSRPARAQRGSLRICDVTQFYSPFGGGVKRYLTEKRRYVLDHTDDEHVLVVPGAATEYTREGRLHTITIKSPVLNRSSQYRVLLNRKQLRIALAELAPDLIECGDPYQIAWTVLAEARRMNIPAVGFYHSHFPEAYVRPIVKYGGPIIREAALRATRRYVRHLYNQFDATLVCTERIRTILREWGVENVRPVRLGVDTDAFTPGPRDERLREKLGVPADAFLLLYVGRLAAEKNIEVLVESFERLHEQGHSDYVLACVGQGPAGKMLMRSPLAAAGKLVWVPHVNNNRDLARYYRAADLCLHAGVKETFGLVALEAQACGRVVCGIAGSPMDEAIVAGHEFWSREDSGPAFAAAIENVRRQDLAALGVLAAERVRAQFAWPVVFDELWSRYRSLIPSIPAAENVSARSQLFR